MELGDGSAVRLTVSRYYTPTGRSIQKPYEGNDKDQYYNDDFHERYLNGELQSRDSIKVSDSLKYTTPKGKTVYGGGGIIPDVFVPIDTIALFGAFHIRAMNDFVFDYVDNNRKELEQLTFEDFLRDFDKDEKIFNSYLTIIKKEYNGEVADETYIKHYLKSFFAQFLYDDSAFNMVLNQNDKILQRVQELEHQIDYVKH